MISRELLSEVLKKNVTHIQESINKSEICYMINGETKGTFLNIYELAHKCKEWALKKGYELRTSTRGVVDFYAVELDYEFVDNLHKYKTEPESIFKVCEWILKDKR